MTMDFFLIVLSIFRILIIFEIEVFDSLLNLGFGVLSVAVNLL